MQKYNYSIIVIILIIIVQIIVNCENANEALKSTVRHCKREKSELLLIYMLALDKHI